MSATRLRRGVLGATTALLLGAGLAGCQLPDVGMSPGLTAQAAESTDAGSSAAAPSVTPVPAAEVAGLRPAGDLDTGSITHSVAAGDRSVVIDWWTAEDATTWTADGAKTVQLSAHVEGGNARQAITVTRFVATSDDGTARATVAEDRGEFVLTPPFSYTTALNLTSSTAGATDLALYAQFDLLVETEPGSGEFFRQTVLDRIQLPLLQEETQ